jgi:hypothetical protein
MPSIAVIQHSVVMLENGNAVVHVSDKAENLFKKVDDTLKTFKNSFKVRWMDLSEGDGISTLSLVLEPADGLGEKIFIYRADRALFFQNIGPHLKKFGIVDSDISKMCMAESMGYITAAYSYEKVPVESAR